MKPSWLLAAPPWSLRGAFAPPAIHQIMTGPAYRVGTHPEKIVGRQATREEQEGKIAYNRDRRNMH